MNNANNVMVVKKLQDEIVKLKSQLSSTASKLKETTKMMKQQKMAFKVEFKEKCNAMVESAFVKAQTEAEKKMHAREKVLADALNKFEKEWAKNQKSTPKPKMMMKKKKSMKKAMPKMMENEFGDMME